MGMLTITNTLPSSSDNPGGGGGGGVPPYKRLMGIRRWMGSHFHGWNDYRVTRMVAHIF